MTSFSESEKNKIIKTIEDKGAKLPCSRCGTNKFILIDGYFNNTIQKDLKTTALGGRGVPSVVVACAQCGNISQHAIGILGLMPKEEAEVNVR